MNKNDRRYQRTRRNIKEAFLRLLQQKSFEKININDISALADINRSTFYLHYEDKYALLDECIKEKLSFLVSNSEQEAPPDVSPDAEERIRRSLEYFIQEKEFFRIMLREENAPFFTPAFREVLETILKPLFAVQKESNPLQIEFEIHLRLSALSGILEWWLIRDIPIPLENMTRNMMQVLKQLETPCP